MSPRAIIRNDFDQPPPVLPIRRPGLLVATGQPYLRVALALHLTGRGFEVWTAPDGVQAFDTFLAHTGEIDVLLLDAEMPDLPGPAFYRRLRAHFPGTPCCFLADSLQRPAAQEVQKMGATVVVRPYSFQRLLQTLWSLVPIDTGTEA